MASIKIKGRWYEESSLTDELKKEAGLLDENGIDIKAIKEELKKVPESIKKNHAENSKDNNISAKKVVIGTPTLKQNKKKKGAK